MIRNRYNQILHPFKDLSLPQSLCLLHWKNGVDKVCVNTLIRNWRKSTIQMNDRLLVQNERFC